MYRTPSVLGPLNSGFVPFSSGAPMDAVAEVEAAEVVARAAAGPAPESIEHAAAAVWMPAGSARIRAVEAIVIAAICGYFGLGLLSAFAGF